MAALEDKVTELLTDTTLTRGRFVKAGGVLAVTLAVPISLTGKANAAPGASAQNPTTLDPGNIGSWLEIHADGTVVARTGRIETGVGMSVTYAQIIAEELDVPFESIKLIMGSTDETPDGGVSAGFLHGTKATPFGGGALNQQKVAAYTRQALLALASAKLGVPVSQLTVKDGVVSGGSGSVSYAQLVEGQELKLTIPVTGKLTDFRGVAVVGNPPTKDISQYRVIGRSMPRSDVVAKVAARNAWLGDVRLPGMLHARMVRPATLGSTLIRIEGFGRSRFPGVKVIQKGNLVAVVSKDEYEAIAAAAALKVKWTMWEGLPGSDKLEEGLRGAEWGTPVPGTSDKGDAGSAFASAPTQLSTRYLLPYVKHAPIGPYVAVADVRADGKVHVWSHSAHTQTVRMTLAAMLQTSPDNVVVHWLYQSGQYGRMSWGGDGPEADAVILAKELGVPVRVQWSRQEDHAWSTASAGSLADMRVGLDANGNMVSYEMDHYMPTSFDVRPVGAVLAGLPAMAAIQSMTVVPTSKVATVWLYDKVPNVREQASGTLSLGSTTGSTVGLRGNIMRTPWQRQQNFALESSVNEAAAKARRDPVQYRLDHTTDQRLIDILRKTARAADWETRPSPRAKARATGSTPATGQGVVVMKRDNSYWVGIAHVSVVPSTGKVTVTKITIGVDPGKIINPKGLQRIIEGGTVQGLSEGLLEEVKFDKAKVTSIDWKGYPILTMKETPPIQVVTINREDAGFGGGGEAPNSLGPAAVAAAVFDATGKPIRRLPMTPAYVRAALRA